MKTINIQYKPFYAPIKREILFKNRIVFIIINPIQQNYLNRYSQGKTNISYLVGLSVIIVIMHAMNNVPHGLIYKTNYSFEL